MKRPSTIGILLFLLLLAGLLRLPHLDTSHAVAGDESMWGNAANNVLKHPLFVLNATHHLPPEQVRAGEPYRLYNRNSAYPLLISVPIAIWGSNLFSLRIVACVSGILLVCLLFVLARRTHGTTAALAAAFVMAVLPAAVFFSRMAFNEALVALIGYLIVWTGMQQVNRWKTSAAVGAGLLIGFGYLVKAFEVLVIVGPALGILFLLHLSWQHFRWLLITGATFLVVIFMPTLLRLMFTPWATGAGLETLWFDDAYDWKQPFVFYFDYLIGEFSLFLPFVGIGIFAGIRDAVSGRNRVGLIWLSVAAMILIISLPSTKKATYFYILLPAWSALAGLGIHELLILRRRGMWERWIITALYICIAVITFWLGLEPEVNLGTYFLLSRQFIDEWWSIGLLALFSLGGLVLAAGWFSDERKWLARRGAPGILLAMALIATVLTAGGMHRHFDEIDELRKKSQRSFEPGAIARLQEAVISQWPDRNILVGQRAHSAAIRYHNGTRWPVPYLLYSNEDHLRRMLIGVEHNDYVFFVNSHDLQFNRYERKDGLSLELSEKQKRAYEILSRKYDDVTPWFRDRFKLDAGSLVYCLAHVDPTVLDEALATH